MSMAAQNGHVAVVDALIAAKAHLNAANKVITANYYVVVWFLTIVYGIMVERCGRSMFCDERVACVLAYTLTISIVVTALYGRMVPHR